MMTAVVLVDDVLVVVLVVVQTVLFVLVKAGGSAGIVAAQQVAGLWAGDRAKAKHCAHQALTVVGLDGLLEQEMELKSIVTLETDTQQYYHDRYR